MANTLSAQKFLKSEEAESIRGTLLEMVDSKDFNTTETYSPAAGGVLTFVDKHINYLSQHTATNITHYMSNLRLKTRIR